MLKKKDRIPAALFKNIRSERTIRGRFIVIKLFQEPKPTGRCAVVVPKSVAKKATKRNALRRTMYEWIRVHRPIPKSENALILPLPSLAEVGREELDTIFNHAFSKL